MLATSTAQVLPQDPNQINTVAIGTGWEALTILEGFREAERVHEVCYMHFVGDGNSSVYPTLILEVPVWGRHKEA